MQLFLENYLIIIIVGLFFVFALVGYLIDMLRKENNNNKKDTESVKPVTITKIEPEIKKDNN